MGRRVYTLKYKEENLKLQQWNSLERELEKSEKKLRLREKLHVRLLLKEIEKIEIRKEEKEGKEIN